MSPSNYPLLILEVNITQLCMDVEDLRQHMTGIQSNELRALQFANI